MLHHHLNFQSVVKKSFCPALILLCFVTPAAASESQDEMSHGGGERNSGAGTDTAGTATVKPADYLASLKAPVFCKTHTLPPLTRYGWTLSFDARVELARRWGYTLEFGGYVTEKRAARLDDPSSMERRLVNLVRKDPETFKLSVICSRRLPFEEAPPEAWTHNADGKLLSAKAESLDGTTWQKGKKLVWSPEAPLSVWKKAGRYRAEPLRKVRRHCPIAIVLNGGEYGLGVLGFARKVWEQDPAVLKAKGDQPWYAYISARKARAERAIAEEVKAVAPDRLLYIYYPTTGGTHRNRSDGWHRWMYGYQWMKPVSDAASSEHYYMHFNSGWTGGNDLLTQALNARGFEIENGSPLCYDWLCAGWPRKKGMGSNRTLKDAGLGDVTRYAGFLKCLYAAGMIGGNAGYYAYPEGGFDAPFERNNPPHWLRQMIVFSRVHALFSHLEGYIRKGRLLPGPARHVWSKTQPAYEFPAGFDDVRVLVRKRNGRDSWLAVAWAAGGKARDVNVTVPGAGPFTLRARPGGSVYSIRRRNGTAAPPSHRCRSPEALPFLILSKEKDLTAPQNCVNTVALVH